MTVLCGAFMPVTRNNIFNAYLMSKLFLVVVLGPFAFLINYSQLVFTEPIFTNSSLNLELLAEGFYTSLQIDLSLTTTILFTMIMIYEDIRTPLVNRPVLTSY